ncbi:methyltransferase domain-containing protein [Runella sp. CRIBMP]|uniref:class I SAM-dependent methyltransferase n=1 Tax=Runella sp. CRIBMP TaxID=2683261 RepID=UPI00141319EE|nr:class I SAM-dependent methyltransferase [Runella sp. CRIBMP]NBB19659.1 methyltransferase domain-containing protein [Runella sp. CRIBMP]
MKDLFSGHATDYARYRPNYPETLYQWVFKHVQHFGKAWDCATGNGQVATVLAKHFSEVEATDLSQAQISQAVLLPNIHYQVSPAETTPFDANTFDLITVGQALHWFDFELFNKEVKRVAKKGAIIAVWGYELLTISPEIDAIIQDFYQNTIGDYWDPERRHIENLYADVPFPYNTLKKSIFLQNYNWSLTQLCHYLNTWSSVRKFEKANGYNPIEALHDRLIGVWGSAPRRLVTFPVFAQLGEV